MDAVKAKSRSVDLTGRRFHRLTALSATDERTKKGYVVWHCRCDCGNEGDYSYNELLYGNRRSCGCQKREHDAALHGSLTHVDGTSIDLLKSEKCPSNNTSGRKGVYFIRGKWSAKIVFKKRAYYLGSYADFESSVRARAEAERLLNDATVAYYERYEAAAQASPEWAAAHPISIAVAKTEEGLSISFTPALPPE